MESQLSFGNSRGPVCSLTPVGGPASSELSKYLLMQSWNRELRFMLSLLRSYRNY